MSEGAQDAIGEAVTSFTNVKFVTVGSYDGVDNITRLQEVQVVLNHKSRLKIQKKTTTTTTTTKTGKVRSDVKSIHGTNNVSFIGNITTGVSTTKITCLFDDLH